MPELRHLRHFVVAAEELNFTRAAARLHMVQQSLSASIRQLERDLDVRLFDRTTRVVRLTPAGEAFLPSARHVLDEADRAFAAIAPRAGTRELAVGFSFSLDDHVRYRLFERFLADNPTTRLRIHTALTGELLDLLSAQEIDLAVAFCPLERRGFVMAPIMRAPAWVLLAADHPLAGTGTLDLRDLRNEPFVLAVEPEGAGFNQWLLAVCRDAGFTPRTIVSPPVAMNIRIADVAPGAVTLATWHPQLASGGNVLRPLNPEVSAPYVAVVRDGTTGFVRDAFDELVAVGPTVADFVRGR
jgi:DNA-binding transcriptional LysR family regulator